MFRTNFSPLNALASRLRRARAGSVLIIVIVLLLLLAILGAAYISTTRSARVASAQTVLSADVDSMLDGVAKVCEGVLVDDLNDTNGNLRGNTAYAGNTVTFRNLYRGSYSTTPPVTPSVPPGAAAGSYLYNPGDIINDASTAANQFIFYAVPGAAPITLSANVGPASGLQVLNGHLPITAIGSDPWLMDRVPILDPPGTGVPAWTNITQTIVSNGTNLIPRSIIGTPFVDPRTGADLYAASKLQAPFVAFDGAGALTPTTTATPPATPGGYPAFDYGGNPATLFAAADADGDGIADALFFLLPGASTDGLTWYAAVRIIDNNSAINANTAISRDALIFNSGGQDTWNLFQTSIGLKELVNAGDSGAAAVTKYMTQNQTTFSAAMDESTIYTNTAPATFVRTDYQFSSKSEAYYHQLIRRINNPGYIASGVLFKALPLSDEAALAYHFCLQNSNSLSQSLLETLLPNSLLGTSPNAVPSTAYDPSQAILWFSQNFNYDPTSDAVTAPISLRPLLVTRNPVSNYIQQVYDNGTTATNSEPILPNYMLPYGTNTTSGALNPSHYRGVWNGNPGPPPPPTYNPNDIVAYPSNGGVAPTYTPWQGPSNTYICVATNSATAPATYNANKVLTAVTTAAWQLQPWVSNPVKANVNTATFRELFRAFWCVMAGNPSNTSPFGVTGVDGFNIYDPTAPSASAPTSGNAQAMFRSPLRDIYAAAQANGTVSMIDAPTTAVTATAKVSGENAMVLRAAIAAVNAIGLRDNSQNIISRIVDLPALAQIDTGSGAQQENLEAEVFSNAPQPVISEVYANTYAGPDATDPTIVNPQGYVAIELYNPYSFPMTLNNWQLGLVNRTATQGAAAPVNTTLYPNLEFEVTATAASPSVIGPIQAQNDPTNLTATTPPIAGTIIIPAHGYALLENYNGGATSTTTPNPGDATGRPANANFKLTAGTPVQKGIWYGPGGSTAPNTCDVYVQNLQLVIQTATGSTVTSSSTGGELVLLRPRRADGNLSASADPVNGFSEGTFTTNASTGQQTITSINLHELVPVDAYDFSGLTLGTSATGTAWSYVRQKTGQTGTAPITPSSTPSTWFQTFYPGFYNGFAATPMPREFYGGTGGTIVETITTATANPTWATGAPSFGVDSATGSYTNNFPPIQVYNLGNTVADTMHFPNATVSPGHQYPNGITPPAGGYLYPLGGFARNGDMLDIPFVGAYRIRIKGGTLDQVGTGAGVAGNPFLELNSLPRDCSLAAVETGAVTGDQAENIGRFMPMAASYSYVKQISATPTAQLPDYYSWTRNLFNYLTVQSPDDAYLPNFDPNLSSSTGLGTNLFAYPPQNAAGGPIPPTPVLTADPTAPDETKQDNVGVEGLININTASWKVLSMIPFVPNSVAGAPAINRQIAQNIVNYRRQYGPFMSIFDLNKVPGFQSAASPPAVAWSSGPLPVPTVPIPPTSTLGLLSPADPNFGTTTPSTTATGVPEDYQWDCLTLTRISNLVTTRSDTFTVYVEIQGWQNVGSTSAASPPAPVITRRYAYIVDRSAINGDPNSRFAKTLPVPND
jgi:hypothetical protein